MKLLALLLALALVRADDKPVSVALPHDWAVGTRYHFELTKSREDVEGEQPPKLSSTRMPVEVEVLARREDGYRVRWTFGHPDAAPEASLSRALEQKIAGLVEGLVMDFDTDATGSVTKLVNPSAMDAHFKDATLRLSAQMESSNAPWQDVQAVVVAAAKLKGPSMQSAWLQLPTRFYMPSGATLVVGEKRTYADQLPNPFGGDPLPAQSSLTLREVHADKHEAVVEWRTSIDATKAGPILEASMRAYAQKVGQELPQGKPLTFDAIEDAATYVYDLATGIPRSVVTTRTTIMAGNRRVDMQRYDVTLPQKK